MKVIIVADHRGQVLANQLAVALQRLKYVVAQPNASKAELTDFPLMAKKYLKDLKADEKAIVICGSGGGMNIAANKIKGVRASLGLSVAQVKAMTSENKLNVLALAASYTTLKSALLMSTIFLKTKFAGLARQKRREKQIQQLEKNN